MQRTLPCRFTDLAECLGRYGANRMYSGADAHLASFGELAHTVLPMIDVSIAEAGLYRIQPKMTSRGQPAG